VSVLRVVVFLDYWNFQIGWNHRAPLNHQGKRAACDFLSLPQEAVALGEGALGAQARAPLRLVQTRIYASHDPDNPKDLQNREWMTRILGQREGFSIRNTPRFARSEPTRCRECSHEVASCPRCKRPYKRAAEKTVDAAIIVDLLSMAWDNLYDVALLISSDHDFLPAIDTLHHHNMRVINGRWSDQGTRLADSCDASIRLDALVPILARGLR
jgi:uncharacterized LabA/DUF88 family protein